MSIKQYPSIDYVRQCLEETEPGKLFWKTRPRDHFKTESAWKMWNFRFAGMEAGSIRCKTRGNRKKIYRCAIMMEGKLYHRHVIIYALHHNVYPNKGETVDHKDRDSLNDKIENLRIATPIQSSGNTSRYSTNKSGFKGVHFCKYTNRWRAVITIDGKTKPLGRFDTPEEAHQRYKQAATERFGEFACDGQNSPVTASDSPVTASDSSATIDASPVT